MPQTHPRFGVEQEHFILHADGSAPSHAEIDELYARLCEQGFGLGSTDSRGRVLSVERRTEQGPLVVTNDACTHLLEVAFPPWDDLEQFGQSYSDTFGLLAIVLRKLGLEIRAGGAMSPPREIHWRPNVTDPSGRRIEAGLNRPAIDHPLFERFLPGCIAATQVSLSVPAVEAIERLAAYYQFEPLVPLLFGQSPVFGPVRGRCLRPLALMANFPPSDPLVGVPRCIPASLDHYEELRRQCSIRDFSFVAIRSANRLEFRSACSQPSLAETLLLVRFRLAVERACRRPREVRPTDCRAAFFSACWSGEFPQSRELLSELIQLDSALEVLAQKLDPTLARNEASQCSPRELQ